MRVGVRELRNQTAAWIRRAGDGERVIVTVDGRPVAQLGPIDGDGVSLDDLAARGLLVPARRTDRGRPGTTYAPYSGFRLDRALQELRGR
jgi:prevent-host-death family protein